MLYPSVVTLIPGTSGPLKLIDSISLNAGINTNEALWCKQIILKCKNVAKYIVTYYYIYMQLHDNKIMWWV